MSTTTPEGIRQLTFAEPPIRWPGAHVLLWSQSQNALHIEPLEAMLRSNRRAYTDDRPMDYVPLCIGNDEDCHAIADSVRGTVRKRDDEREGRLQQRS